MVRQRGAGNLGRWCPAGRRGRLVRRGLVRAAAHGTEAGRPAGAAVRAGAAGHGRADFVRLLGRADLPGAYGVGGGRSRCRRAAAAGAAGAYAGRARPGLGCGRAQRGLAVVSAWLVLDGRVPDRLWLRLGWLRLGWFWLGWLWLGWFWLGQIGHIHDGLRLLFDCRQLPFGGLWRGIDRFQPSLDRLRSGAFARDGLGLLFDGL